MQVIHTVLAVLMGLASTTSALPLSDCYALDKDNYLYDFTDKIGKELNLEGEISDFVLRFCVDAQNRSTEGYVNYGRFSPQPTLKPGLDNVDFVQVYNYGDLRFCEHIGNNFTGRKAEVEIICGTCLNGAICKDDFGCLCNATYYHSLCKVKVLAAVDCSRRGPRVFPDFSIGLQQRGWEVVKNGITQTSFRKSYNNQSFESSQSNVFLYVTSTTGFLGAIEKSLIQVHPFQGLFVKMTHKATLSTSSARETTTFIQVDWKCLEIQEQPYEVKISIPINGYDPVEIFLYKQCSIDDFGMQPGLSNMRRLQATSLIIVIGVVLLGILYNCKLRGEHKMFAEAAEPLICDVILDEVNSTQDTCHQATRSH